MHFLFYLSNITKQHYDVILTEQYLYTFDSNFVIGNYYKVQEK